jgi:hypothetical protein
MSDLKLIALDEEDLGVISAHLQDAVLRVVDMTYLKGERRFAAVVNRFDWTKVTTAGGAKPALERRRSGLRFDRVLGAQISGIDLKDQKAVLSLLAIEFTSKDAPEGYVTLHFSGGGAIRLHVECIEAELADLGAAWSTKRQPKHADDTNGGTS